MSRAILGERVGRSAVPRPIAIGVIFDSSGEKVLLTRRADNGRWCLPGGSIDPGESAEEACVREVEEETGLVVRVTRLIGIYTSPDLVVEYPEGNRIQPVVLSFQAQVTGGELRTTGETTAFGYFNEEELAPLDLLEFSREEVQDAMRHQSAAFIR